MVPHHKAGATNESLAALEQRPRPRRERRVRRQVSALSGHLVEEDAVRFIRRLPSRVGIDVRRHARLPLRGAVGCRDVPEHDDVRRPQLWDALLVLLGGLASALSRSAIRVDDSPEGNGGVRLDTARDG